MKKILSFVILLFSFFTFLQAQTDITDRISDPDFEEEQSEQSLWKTNSFGRQGNNDFTLKHGTYPLSWGYYRGDRIGIYCFNDLDDSGYVDVDWVKFLPL